MRRVSLADVARAAGVAKATASRALSQEHRDVGEATRARIQGIAADMGYQPSQVAQALRTGRFQVLGLLIPQAHPDWAELVLGATTEASRRGYDLLIRLPRSGVALSDQATGLSIDGVIAVAEDPAVPPAPVPAESGVPGHDEVQRPVVVVDQRHAPAGAVVVRADEFEAGSMACRHLLERGSRSIALVAPQPAGAAVAQRLDGGREVLRQNGVEPVAELSVPGPAEPGAPERLPALEALLETGAHLDGIVALGGTTGPATLATLHRAGRAVPGDVRVIGFDPPSVAAPAGLSSVGAPAREVGALAVAELVQRIEGRGGRTGVHAVAPGLQARGSSAPARSGDTAGYERPAPTGSEVATPATGPSRSGPG